MSSDLKVLPFLAAHDSTEADVVLRPRVCRVVAPDGILVGTETQELTDLAAWGDRETLAQALVLRLLTPAGSLATLGHPSYGSRLHELIGQRKNSATRALCRAFVLEAVAQEPRVDPTALALDFDLPAERLDSFVFVLSVQRRDVADPLSLALEVGL